MTASCGRAARSGVRTLPADVEFSTTTTDVDIGAAPSPASDVVSGDVFDAGSITSTGSWTTEEVGLSKLDGPGTASVAGGSDSDTESATGAAGSGSDFDSKMLELSSCVTAL